MTYALLPGEWIGFCAAESVPGHALATGDTREGPAVAMGLTNGRTVMH